MFISAPKSTIGTSFSKPRMGFKHLLCTVGFQHDLCILNRIAFGYIYLEMHMIPCKSKITKLKTETFQIIERFNTCIYMALFFEAIIPLFSDEQHRHPIIAGVTRNLFRAIAIFINQIFHESCRVI